MAVDHYENFPVASILLPPAQRSAVVAIYRFARTADDIADEGTASPAERLALLDRFSQELDRIGRNEHSVHPVFAALAPVIAEHQLPLTLFHDLLDAFKQDVHQTRYASHAELLDYCRRSANPVGRLLLHLTGHASEANLQRSDAICTALQLINHWQDVAIDLDKGSQGRIYLPQDDMARFGVTDAELMRRTATTVVSNLLAFELDRAVATMHAGASLGWDLPGRFGMEIRAIVAGGLRVAQKIAAVNYDVFGQRPTLRWFDWPAITWRTVVRPLSLA